MNSYEIHCPVCHACYQADVSLLGEKVQCTCGAKWYLNSFDKTIDESDSGGTKNTVDTFEMPEKNVADDSDDSAILLPVSDDDIKQLRARCPELWDTLPDVDNTDLSLFNLLRRERVPFRRKFGKFSWWQIIVLGVILAYLGFIFYKTFSKY